ncbi:hypothetical protein K5E_25690 [Enterococcus thailandicus]|uniref:GDSL-type esterase/lipase family protein n=1 Tax=Enterococcus thailandicus TaxID=417368 RepID=UPI00244D84D2|nr:GDSL-type esterase/lipase family protein [Enterococcus thailandicus]GMC10430.1 hypothetical protein K5E_25690 [Enterococcus thailandicus]
MSLDQFRDVDLVIDKANNSFTARQFISQNDNNGRTFTVQVTDNGTISRIPGLSLNLRWHNQNTGITDLTAFELIDADSSVFRVTYPKHMMNAGTVQANIQVLNDGKSLFTRPFEIKILSLAGEVKGIIEKAEFSALVQALTDANGWRSDLDYLFINKADQAFVDSQLATIVSGAPKGTFNTLADLQKAYPSGTNGIFLVLADGHWYYWQSTVSSWLDGGLYKADGIADGSVTRPKTNFFNKMFTDYAVSGSWETGFYYDRTTGEKVVNGAYGSLEMILAAGHSYTIFGTRNGESRHVTYWDTGDGYVGGASTTTIRVSSDTKVRVGLRIDEKSNVSIVDSLQSYLFNDPQSFSTTFNLANLAGNGKVDWYVSDKTISDKDVLLMSETGFEINSELLASSATVAITANGKRFSIKFSDMKVDSNLIDWSTSNVHRWIFFNPYNKTFYVGAYAEANSSNVDLQNSFYLGTVFYSEDAFIRRQSTNIIAVSYRGKNYPSISLPSLISSMQLKTARLNCFSNSEKKPIVDYVSRKITLLKDEAYIIDKSGSYSWWGGSSEKLTEDYVFDIPSDVNTGYLFVVDDKENTRLLIKNASELASSIEQNEYYLGYITMNAETNSLTIPHRVIHTAKQSDALNISFLGDSITTFKGYIPLGTGHYPSSDVTVVEDTWWMKVINQSESKLQLLMNNSRSGSQMADYGTEQVSSDAGVNRCENLDKNGVSPDIIEVRMGTNDFNRNIPLGDYDVTSQDPATSVDEFISAYCVALDRMTAKYPNARIIMHTLPFNNYGGFPRVREDGLTLADFNEAIRKIAKRYNCDLVDEEKANFNKENIMTLTEEGLHPKKAGMFRIFEQAYDVVKKYLV